MLPDAQRPTGLGERATVVHSNLIVKATTDEYPHLTQNEFLCMSAAKMAGIPVPNFWLSEDGGLFVLERFDLTPTAPLGFEDMSVLMGNPHAPSMKAAMRGLQKPFDCTARTPIQ